MRIFVTMKQLGKRRDVLGRIPFDLPEAPRTLRDLLTMMVKTMVAQYNARQLETPVFHYLAEDDLLNSAEQTGKVGFGTRYNEKDADPERAVTTAIQAFEDGLYRVFTGNTELTSLDAPLGLAPDETITLIRLTMLAGRMW